MSLLVVKNDERPQVELARTQCKSHPLQVKVQYSKPDLSKSTEVLSEKST